MGKRCTYVLVLNWNGWALSNRCLESLFRSTSTPEYRVIVWDNGSTDGSADKMAAWAAGKRLVEAKIPERFRDCVMPPVPKPIRTAVLDEGQPLDADSPLTIIRGSANLGYAGGNNRLLEYALAQPDCAAVWVINNDVVLAADCFAQMDSAHRQDLFDRPIGAAIYDFEPPHALQAWGGQRLGRGWLVAPRHIVDHSEPDFLVGASLYLSATRARQLGFFNEGFFLNAEDLEYTYAYARRFTREHPGQSPFIITGCMWHQESASQGKSAERHAYYFTRNIQYAARGISLLHGCTTFAYGLVRVVWSLLRGRRLAAYGTARGLAHSLVGIKGPWIQ